MNNKVQSWVHFYTKNYYYHNQIQKLVSRLVPADSSVLEIGSLGGELLTSLTNKQKYGLEEREGFYKYAQENKKRFIFNKWSDLSGKKFDYIILTHVFSHCEDAQTVIHKLKKYCHNKSKVIVLYFNFFWKPALDVAEKMNLKRRDDSQPNWLTSFDVNNLFYLESFVPITQGSSILLPIGLPLVSETFNKFFANLPLVNHLNLINYSIYSPAMPKQDYSVSIVIPARNEAGNMKGVMKKIPKLGKKTEVVFVEGNSQDDTYEAIKKEIRGYKGPMKLSLYKQTGRGKGDAVRLGFSKARNDILMILDADLTVDPSELPKFYSALSQGVGEFIMGSRLVYQMESQAMRNLNLLGNKFFSLAFSFLLNQKIKDTLCGTKVILKDDYKKIEANRNFFGDFDPFGDFDLIFGASKLNLKITEIPIHYKERTYGTTNISRFSHGFLLLKMVFFAARKIKFI